MKKLLGEFKKFAIKGNVIDMAVGVMVGGAFSKIVTSLVNDVFMPVLSLLTGKPDTANLFVALNGKTYETIELAVEDGASVLKYGAFIQTVIDFLLIAICIFAFVKLVARLHKKDAPPPAPAPAPRLCPFCMQVVDKKATRCHHCTSELPKEEE